MSEAAFDWKGTVLSQYANSPTLFQWLTNIAGYFDQTANVNAFYNDVWNILTAQGYGLDVWGRIVGVGRVLVVANHPVFGYKEATTGSASPFNEGVFYPGGSDTSGYSLPDATYRTLILAKAFANICNGSTPAINETMLLLFPGQGDCYVTDNLNMTLTYTFQFALTAVQEAVLLQSGVLPRPCAVSTNFTVP